MKYPKGFTLVEIITVIGIFALLLGLVLANLDKGKQSQKLRETSLQLVDHLREMQNDTLTGKTEKECHVYDDTGSFLPDETGGDCHQDSQCTPSPVLAGYEYKCEEVVPPGGYGVYLDPAQDNQYILFADYDTEFRTGTAGLEYQYEGVGNTDFFVQTVTLPTYIHIKDVKSKLLFDRSDRSCAPSDGSTSYFINENSPVSLTWSQPNGELYVKYDSLISINDPCPNYQVSILLAHERTDYCREIIINGTSGLIEEKANNACAL